MKNKSVSVFFPAFNDAKSIGKLIDEAYEVLIDYTEDFEIIVINDGSTDDTAEVLSVLAEKYRVLKIVTHEKNRGYGAALISGFHNATGEFVFYTDGDGQYDVTELVLLLSRMESGVDVVNGYKIGRSDNRIRKIIGKLYNRFAHLLFELPIRDIDCDFRLIRKSRLDQIDLESVSGSICVELIYKLQKAGGVFAEIPVSHYPRLHGKSQFFTFAKVVPTLIDLIHLRIKTLTAKSLVNYIILSALVI